MGQAGSTKPTGSTRRGRSKAVNLRTVAEAVGVSQTTVSRVLNNSDIPAPQTRKRVLEAVASLNYQPDPALGEAIRRRRLDGDDRREATRTIGFITSERSLEAIHQGDAFYSSVVIGIQQALNEHRRHLMLSMQPEGNDEIPLLVSERRVDGLLVSCDLPPVVSRYVARQMPIVFLGRPVPEGMVADMVRSDAYRAMTTQLKYLHGLGHRRIAYFEQTVAESGQQQRRAAFRDFAQAVGLADLIDHPLNRPRPIAPRTHDQVLDQYAEELLATSPRPTALIAPDGYAPDLLQRLQSCGLRVPEAISICGMHEHGKGSFTSPPLTSYRVPMDRIGRQAVQFLLERLEGSDSPARRLMVGGEPVIRASCAPPPPECVK